MKRPILRRLLAVTGSVTLGLMGAVALASPAQAHHTDPSGFAQCTPTEWVITWTIKNWDTDLTATVDLVAKPDTPIKSIVDGSNLDGATLPGKSKKNGKWVVGELVGEQRVPLSTDKVELVVKGTWSNGVKHTAQPEIVKLDRSKCGERKVDILGKAKCDYDTGNWNVTWTVANKHYTDQATANIITQDGPDSQKSAIKKANNQWVTLANENVIVGLKDGDKINGGQAKTATQVVEGSAKAARLKVQLEWKSNFLKNESDSQVRVVEFDGSCVKNTPKPTAAFASDCSGEVTVTLKNIAGATKKAVFVVKGAGDWASEPIEVEADGTATVTVPASASSSITVLESGTPIEKGTYSWTDKTECHPVDITSEQTCDKVIVTINNPAGGAAATVVLTPVKGSAPAETEQAVKALSSDAITKTVAPGTKETVEFEVGETGLVVHTTVNGEQRGSITWKKPAGCEPIGGEVADTCDGLVFDLKNPQDGSKTDLVLTPSKGEAVSFTLNPGETKKVEFKADKELTVKVTLNGKVVDEIVWEKPKDCDKPSPSPSAPPTLPKTGTNVTIFVISGLLLVAVGFAVFMLARRRRLNMTEV
ncbi:LPXTG cell wall anchor domain-containing protein [Catellatospora paridis]|uniref:LPXTG cell wall anchor domain-containing protein n=1 Tax=Catellatospora paridis TaxID=1617086 RepID=UPI0012D4102F|nr:LPXTG cell wall anchor domain-containing protein [Catellatospora paridis]